MKGEVFKEINNFFTRNGLSESTMLGRIKIRSIRIQISLQGINLANYSPESIDKDEDITKIKTILNKITLGEGSVQ
ncbi:MAG: hypothetical protein SFU98_01365 [Leptospiraceae bacterium]|nr:hypothetical protein [Leptospiraceae bacterium]